jgi:hypothetical protein
LPGLPKNTYISEALYQLQRTYVILLLICPSLGCRVRNRFSSVSVYTVGECSPALCLWSVKLESWRDRIMLMSLVPSMSTCAPFNWTLIFFFKAKLSLHSRGWPWTVDPPTLASLVLRLQTRTTPPGPWISDKEIYHWEKLQIFLATLLHFIRLFLLNF